MIFSTLSDREMPANPSKLKDCPELVSVRNVCLEAGLLSILTSCLSACQASPQPKPWHTVDRSWPLCENQHFRALWGCRNWKRKWPRTCAWLLWNQSYGRWDLSLWTEDRITTYLDGKTKKPFHWIWAEMNKFPTVQKCWLSSPK